jgi:homoserine dehydrogenase
VALATFAEEQGVALAFEASSAGGIPVVKTLREALPGNNVTRLYGILNGTCNYILSRMEMEGLTFEACLPTPSVWAMPKPIRPSTSRATTPPISSPS